MTKCHVYWIRLPEHTDIFTQGYVGITTHTVEERFQSHLKRAESSGNFVIHKALRKYKDIVIVNTVLIADVEYCKNIEYKLRPNSFIGWNIAPGGGGYKNLVHNEESLTKLSNAVKLAWKEGRLVPRRHSDEARSNMSKSKKGIPISENTRNGFLEFIKNASPWETARGNKNVWFLAGEVYNLWVENNRIYSKLIYKPLGLTKSQISTMVEKFKEGWCPFEDDKWTAFYSSYKEKEYKK